VPTTMPSLCVPFFLAEREGAIDLEMVTDEVYGIDIVTLILDSFDWWSKINVLLN